MTSRITKTDGSILTTIADGTVDNSTNLVLIGKNYAGYGDFLNENFVHLLENAASDIAPTSPLTGQLWWDKLSTSLKVWTGEEFKIISSSTSQDTPPTNPIVGDLWWDTFNSQLNVFNGTAWTLIGPAFTTAMGTSGTVVDSITDDNGDAHIAIKIFIEETLVAVISKDTSYNLDSIVEADIYNAFTSIGPGINLASRTEISDISFYGTATDSTTLANVAATDYARTDAAAGQETFYNSVAISNNSGLSIGPNNTYTQTINGNSAVLTNNISDASSNPFVVKTNVAGVMTETLLISGNAEVKVSTAPNISTASNLSVATMKNIRDVGGTEVLLRNGSRTITGNLTIDGALGTGNVNLGNGNVRFGTFFTTTVNANSILSATIGNSGSAITANSVSSAFVGNAGTVVTANTVTANTLTVTGNISANVGLNAPYATISTALYAANYYFANGTPFIPGVASLNSQVGVVTVSGTSGISVSTANNTISITQASGYNGFGIRTISTSAPSGGSNGDVWYQI